MFLIFFIILIFPVNFKAETFPKIFGCFCEGGVITGNLENGSKLKIDNKQVEVFEKGRFIYAFGRKYKDNVKIEINDKVKKFTVSKKKYKIENIKGLPRKKVEPSKEDLNKIISDQNKIKKAKLIGYKTRLFNEKFILPSKGRMSGFYGSQRILNSKPRRPHAGIDIAAKAVSYTHLTLPTSPKV